MTTKKSDNTKNNNETGKSKKSKNSAQNKDSGSNFDFSNPKLEAIMPNFTDFETLNKEAQSTMKESSEAFAKSGALASKGLEKYLKTVTELMQNAAQRHSEMFEEALKCKSIKDISALQQKHLQRSVDEALENLGQITNVTVQLYTESLEPIQSHLTETYKKFGDKVAA